MHTKQSFNLERKLRRGITDFLTKEIKKNGELKEQSKVRISREGKVENYKNI
ncbi:hypothetical protein B7P43_G03253 [Cryptotermes secundus]|uniref:Uncharacterized protein n=1 Tax=Cryptotermes secundus TaxID=105785 RepID=A0A2J7RHP6_9NEOP|nr:hypothetical protein B7P43_G03253 [Cryptotermes secundus]